MSTSSNMGSSVDRYMPCLSQETFHRFPDLPKELRLQIWEAAVPRERLIHISLKVHVGRRYELAVAEPRYLTRNALRKPISGERYRAVVKGRQLNSKLLSVNCESRKVAMAFYRVHLPVYLTGPTVTEKTTLLLNPEHDLLHIDADAPVKETLLDLLWDLKAYDPKDVGLLKLAVDLDSFCANDLQYLKTSDIFLIRQRAALVDTLSQLKAVWFINPRYSRRTRKRHAIPITATRLLNVGGAVPVTGGQPTLECVGADPRTGLEDALQHLDMGDVDPREILFRWRRLLRTWGVEHDETRVEYRMAVTAALERDPVWGVGMTEKLLSVSSVVDSIVDRDCLAHSGGDPVTEQLLSVSSVVDSLVSRNRLAHNGGDPAPVAGFWLFPVEALGEIGEGDKLSAMDFQPRRSLDMREYWPQLVVTKCWSARDV